MAWLDSEITLSIAAFLVATVWSLAKGTEWWDRQVAKKYGVVVEAIEAGVAATYSEYVEGIKLGSADGKLTQEERSTARAMALSRAREMLEKKAIKISDVMTPQEAALWVERGVTSLKAGRGKA